MKETIDDSSGLVVVVRTLTDTVILLVYPETDSVTLTDLGTPQGEQVFRGTRVLRDMSSNCTAQGKTPQVVGREVPGASGDMIKCGTLGHSRSLPLACSMTFRAPRLIRNDLC